MFDPEQYELIDFGDGRKLERFGPYILDRPAPAAEGERRSNPSRWSTADAKFTRTTKDKGRWHGANRLPSTWEISHAIGMLELKAADFGHVGVFPEQAANWDWIADHVQRAGRTLKVLNLFAYTGGSTLAAASKGAEVVHVDAAKNTVAWARRNAKLSGLADAPIRWICDDAVKFVERELRRGNRYDAVILDPPSYGHGPKGEVWKLSDGLMTLLSACGQLTGKQRAFFVVTCHSPGYGPAELQACLADAVFGHCQVSVKTSVLSIQAVDGRRLPSGIVARWTGYGV
jgi:23S rRNA (cytosine1962-C5)-methyltransferase